MVSPGKQRATLLLKRMIMTKRNFPILSMAFCVGSMFCTASLRSQQVSVDTASARAVLQALENPALTYEQAMVVAKLDGNQGMIKEMKELGEAETDEQFARALVAAAHGQAASTPIEEGYDFPRVKANAANELKIVKEIEEEFQKQISDAIRPYTPPVVAVPLRGFVVAGGDGGGYAFGGTDFYLNLLNSDDVLYSRQTLIHEAFHGVQGAAYQEDTAHWKKENAKPADVVRGQFCSDAAELFMDLRNEGTAMFVGSDEPLKDSQGATGKRIYAEFVYYTGHVSDSAALLEVSIASMEAPVPVPLKTVYGVDFFGKGVAYYLGNAITSAIAEQDGPAGVAKVLQQPGYEFVLRYTRLSSYGKDRTHPRLGENTVRAAQLLHDGCHAGQGAL